VFLRRTGTRGSVSRYTVHTVTHILTGRKRLFDVWIRRGPYTNEITLFSQRYKFVGADLDGDAKWISTNEVVMQVYDYPDGVSSYDAEKTGALSNHIATLTFHLDQKSGKFVERK